MWRCGNLRDQNPPWCWFKCKLEKILYFYLQKAIETSLPSKLSYKPSFQTSSWRHDGTSFDSADRSTVFPLDYFPHGKLRFYLIFFFSLKIFIPDSEWYTMTLQPFLLWAVSCLGEQSKIWGVYLVLEKAENNLPPSPTLTPIYLHVASIQ